MEQDELLAIVAGRLECLGVTYAIVGSFASSYYGEARYTHDIDVVVNMTTAQATEFCAGFPPPEWYVSTSAAREAVRQRRMFNLIHPESGNKVDLIVVKDDEWSRLQLSRAEIVEIAAGCRASTAHPEDVILGKLLYFEQGASDKHLRDVAAILQVSGDLVNRERVLEWAERLGVTSHWRAVVERVDSEPEPPDIPF